VARPTHCLRCIELFGPNGAPMIVWRGESRGTFDAIEPLLRPAGRLAHSYPPPRPGWPTMRVVEHRDGRFVAVCDEEMSDRIELTREDVVVHRVDEALLRAWLADMLGLSVSREPAGTLPGVVRVGDWRPAPAVSVPVLLVGAGREDELARTLLEIRGAATKPTIVLTLTRVYWSSMLDAVLAGAPLVLVPVDEVVEEEDGAWSRRPSWDAFVTPVLPEDPEPSAATAPPELAEQVRRLRQLERDAVVAVAELKPTDRPSQMRLAKLAGYEPDATFKNALSNLVKLGLLDNARHHGGRGGYFITERGRLAVEICDQS